MRRGGVVGVVLAVALSLAVVPGAGATRAPHIFGGTPARHAVPFMAAVSIGYPGGRSAFCGGTLVAARFVVTAGHCVAPDDDLGTPSRITVTLGVRDLEKGQPATQPVAATLLHPGFGTLRTASGSVPVNDVAVLRLAAPSVQAPARLPRPEDAALWAPGRKALALGYGLTDDTDDRSFAGRLRQVELPLLPRNRCGRVYGAGFGAADLCAGGPGRDTCSGDSGGPLLVPDRAGTAVLAGVTSFGTQCGTTAGAYTAAGGSVNAFLRSVIPQVEVDAPSEAPAGVPLTVTAVPSDPGGTGPLNGYDALAWDLDADGAFDDATGATATLVPAPGANRVAVQATDAAGDRETRTVLVRAPAPIALRARRARLRGGRFAVSVTPALPGRVRVTARRGDRVLGRSDAVPVAAGRPRRVVVRLTPAGRRLVRARGTVALRLRAVLRPSTGAGPTAARRTVALHT